MSRRREWTKEKDDKLKALYANGYVVSMIARNLGISGSAVKNRIYNLRLKRNLYRRPGEVHTNTIENAFSLLKRGIYGTFHKVSIKHLGRYCNEFSYRFNRRGEQLQMFDGTLANLLRGEVLSYKRLTSQA